MLDLYFIYHEERSFSRIREEIKQSPVLGELHVRIIRGKESIGWEARAGLIFLEGKVYLGLAPALVE